MDKILSAKAIINYQHKKWEFSDVFVSKHCIEDLGVSNPQDFIEFGTFCSVQIIIKSLSKTFEVNGAVIRRFAKEGMWIGIRFFEPYPLELQGLIEEKGEFPKWMRKSPRIPKVGELKFMPNFAICFSEPRNLICAVGDLGMGGCMLYTDDPHAMILKYDEIHTIEIQPKIDFEPIRFQAQITRCEHDIHPVHKIGVYRIGFKFHQFDEQNKDIFTEKVKKIVDELQSLG